MAIDYTPPLSKDHLLAIGEVAARVAILQQVTKAAIWQLLCLDRETGHAVTSGMTLSDLTLRLRAIGDLRLDGEMTRENFNDLVARLLKVNENRNSILHAGWMIERHFGDPVSQRISARGTLKHHPPKVWRAAEIQAVADETLQLTEAIDGFLRGLRQQAASVPP